MNSLAIRHLVNSLLRPAFPVSTTPSIILLKNIFNDYHTDNTLAEIIISQQIN
jgi:hypothetical protein